MTSTEKSIALIAHDGREQDLLQWWRFNEKLLSPAIIYTNLPATADLPSSRSVITIQSGADGGEMKAGALIADGAIEHLIYFWNPTSSPSSAGTTLAVYVGSCNLRRPSQRAHPTWCPRTRSCGQARPTTT